MKRKYNVAPGTASNNTLSRLPVRSKSGHQDSCWKALCIILDGMERGFKNGKMQVNNSQGVGREHCCI